MLLLAEYSHFGGTGPARVGASKAVDAIGAYDMAENVRERCWNKSPMSRRIRGTAWNDFTCMYGNVSQAQAFDRSTNNGFRCNRYIDRAAIPENQFERLESSTRDFTRDTLSWLDKYLGPVNRKPIG